MRTHARRAPALLVGSFLLAAGLGCDGSLMSTESASLSDLLGSLDASEGTTIGELLNQITVGDLAEAFAAFSGRGFGHPGLTDDQRTQIEALQAQLDSGEITQDQFAESIRELIGDITPGRAFADADFHGSPLGHPMRGPGPGDRLDLTDEQKAAAEAIFEAARTDIEALRDAAQAEIRALLTAEQQLTLDEFEASHQGLPGFGGPRGRHAGPRGFAGERFAELLALTDEQQSAIEAIRENLRTAVEARHEQAHDEFLALLTPEQLALIDSPDPSTP